METQTVKLIKPWGLHPKGEQFEVASAIAELLIQSGRAELMRAPEPEAKTQIADSNSLPPATPVNAAVAARVNKRK